MRVTDVVPRRRQRHAWRVVERVDADKRRRASDQCLGESPFEWAQSAPIGIAAFNHNALDVDRDIAQARIGGGPQIQDDARGRLRGSRNGTRHLIQGLGARDAARARKGQGRNRARRNSAKVRAAGLS